MAWHGRGICSASRMGLMGSASGDDDDDGREERRSWSVDRLIRIPPNRIAVVPVSPRHARSARSQFQPDRRRSNATLPHSLTLLLPPFPFQRAHEDTRHGPRVQMRHRPSYPRRSTQRTANSGLTLEGYEGTASGSGASRGGGMLPFPWVVDR
jgi:hypothetical protein